MVETTLDSLAIVNEIRAIEQREIEMKEEKERLYQRKLELLQLAAGARKNSRDTIPRELRGAVFSRLIERKNHEHSKAQ